MSDSHDLSDLAKQILEEHRSKPKQYFFADLPEKIDAMDGAYQELLDAELLTAETDSMVSIDGNPRRPFRLKD